jgi:hypothetical protein
MQIPDARTAMAIVALLSVAALSVGVLLHRTGGACPPKIAAS